jgi:hypothetical protein
MADGGGVPVLLDTSRDLDVALMMLQDYEIGDGKSRDLTLLWRCWDFYI